MRYLNLIRNIGNWTLYFKIKFGKCAQGSYLFKTRNGIKIEVPAPLLHAFKEIFMEECYMHGPVISNLSPSPVIMDIGANAGFFTLFAAMKFRNAKILSFEPVPANFKQLTKNVEMNNNVDIHCFRKAVADHNGEISLTVKEGESFSTTATIIEHNNELSHKITVPCIRIKDIFDDNGIHECDFLKMDCEGAEYEILLNCPLDYLSRIKRMAIEMHSGTKPEHNERQLREHLNKNGFTTFETPKALAMLFAWK